MKKINILVLLMCMFTLSIQAQEEYKLVKKSMQMFGIAFSITDSTALMTEIMPLDSTYEQKKTHFLYARNEYSAQLANYAKTQNMPHPTTTVSFTKSAKSLQKKYAKMNARLVKDGFTVRIVPISEFKFTTVKYEEPEIEGTETKAQREARKKAEKEARKAAKDKGVRPGMPPGGGPGGNGGMGGPGGGMGGPGGGMGPR